MSARERIAALAEAAGRWRDPAFSERIAAARAIGDRTGFAPPSVAYALDALFGEIDAPTIAATIGGEIGSVAALDGFIARPGRPDVYARARPNVAIVASDTTIGVAIPAAVFALAAGAGVFVRDRRDGLVAAFARTLAAIDPAFGRRLHARTLPDHDDPELLAQLAAADTVVAYGGNDALAALRSHVRPDARFIGYGHRTSVAYVERSVTDDAPTLAAVAGGLATDALLYDGSGCLSVHLAFVEADGSSARRAAIADAVERACRIHSLLHPPRADDADARRASLRGAAMFRAAQTTRERVRGDEQTLLSIDPPHDEPPPLAGRALALRFVESPEAAGAYLARHRIPLEAMGFAATPRADLERFALDAGAARIARIGTLQRPPFAGDHGGAPRVLPFVDLVDRA